jgi:protein gp37
MGTKIEWAEESWNPVVGCSKCSPGCDNCYAERMAGRLASMGHDKYGKVVKWVGGEKPLNAPVAYCKKAAGWNNEIYCDESALDKPLHWRSPRRIFVCSMSDLFHPKVPEGMIGDVHAVVKKCPQHTSLMLTKRAERAAEYYSFSRHKKDLPLPNLWLGVSVCVPEEKPKIDALREIPAAVRFVSFEPLLRDMGELDLTGTQWVIVGGESGPGARPMNPDWARGIRDQCKAAGVAFFFKQWGAWLPVEPMADRFPSCGVIPDGKYKLHDWDDYHYSLRVGKKKAGNLLDGKVYEEYPQWASEKRGRFTFTGGALTKSS